MNLIICEIIAVLFSLFSVILTIRENRWCWPVGIIGILFYAVLFQQYGIIGNFYLQGVFLVQSVMGIINWRKSKKDLPITWVSDKLFLINSSLLTILTLEMFIESYGGSMSIMDAITTTLSIFGMILLVYKKIDAWIYWILADIIFIVMFYQSGLYMSAVLYLAFLILATIGLNKWIKSSKIV